MMRVSGAYILELRLDYDAKAVIWPKHAPFGGLALPAWSDMMHRLLLPAMGLTLCAMLYFCDK